ncbi:MAG: DUF5714 domain-containing protein [Evtepia gabavorous]
MSYARPRAPHLVGASLLTAYRNAGGEITLAPALVELTPRQHVPGGVCGFWGLRVESAQE